MDWLFADPVGSFRARVIVVEFVRLEPARWWRCCTLPLAGCRVFPTFQLSRRAVATKIVAELRNGSAWRW